MPSNVTRSSDFIASIGVAAHIEDKTSSYIAGNAAVQLSYLGIDIVRVEAPYANLAEYTALGALGIKFDVISADTNLAQQMALFDSIAPYISSIEGPNEVNTAPVTYDGLTGAAAADAFQKDLYNAVHADPLLQGVSVLPFSLSVGGTLSGYGNVAAYADEGNVHGYASNGVPPYYMLSYAVSSVTTTPGKQPVMSETGYYTLADGNSGVSQYVQGIWIMDTLLENWGNGVAKTYLYQLEDGHSDPASDPENHYGLYTVDGTPKQAATDLHNLTSILADTGADASSFTPGTLNYTISGLNPNYGFSSLFAKSDGRFDLALWSEPQFYNATTGVAAAVTPSAVTIALGGTYDVSIFDPVTGTAAVSTLTGVTSVSLSLGTDPVIVELSKPAIALGRGADAIVVNLSEDAWQGDAQFTIAVDGTQIGGVQSTTALHKTGASQAFTLLGNFGTGGHTVTVSFVNDAYGGTADTDRNLYVDSITTAGGTTVTENATLLSDGSSSFVLPGAHTALVPVTLGSGADAIVVNLSEDAWQGDAQFTIAVDGTQIGGVQSASALHGVDASQAFTLLGNFGTTTHTVTVDFVNDAYGGTADTDRNLYVDSITTASGTTVTENATLLGDGDRSFVLPGTAAAQAPVALGSGTDVIDVALSEDAWQGDAQFTLAVDGSQVGGVQTTTALHGASSETFALHGNFGAGAHMVAVTFVNDAYGGTGATDRNLYVDTITAGGTTVAENAALLSNGTRDFAVSLPTSSMAAITPVTLGSGPDSVTVRLSEDAYEGDAQFTLQVDGKQIGGIQTATALHGSGTSDSFALLGDFGSGSHALTVTFLNDAYGGTSTTDRNLYVDSVTGGGTTTGYNTALYSDGSRTFETYVSHTG